MIHKLPIWVGVWILSSIAGYFWMRFITRRVNRTNYSYLHVMVNFLILFAGPIGIFFCVLATAIHASDIFKGDSAKPPSWL